MTRPTVSERPVALEVHITAVTASWTRFFPCGLDPAQGLRLIGLRPGKEHTLTIRLMPPNFHRYPTRPDVGTAQNTRCGCPQPERGAAAPPRRPAQLILRTALVTFEFKAASPAPAGGLGLEAGMQFRFVQLFAPSRAR